MHAHTYIRVYLQYIHTYTPPRIQYVSKTLSVQYWGVAGTYTVFVCVPIAYTVCTVCTVHSYVGRYYSVMLYASCEFKKLSVTALVWFRCDLNLCGFVVCL